MSKATYKFPKALGACADKLYELREKRQAAQKIVDEIEAEEKALKQHLIDNLPKSEAKGVTGKVACVTAVVKQIPQVSDWDKFYKHILKTKDFSLMQKRLSDGVIKERWEHGEKVPGVEAFQAVTISLTKA